VTKHRSAIGWKLVANLFHHIYNRMNCLYSFYSGRSGKPVVSNAFFDIRTFIQAEGSGSIFIGPHVPIVSDFRAVAGGIKHVRNEIDPPVALFQLAFGPSTATEVLPRKPVFKQWSQAIHPEYFLTVSMAKRLGTAIIIDEGLSPFSFAFLFRADNPDTYHNYMRVELIEEYNSMAQARRWLVNLELSSLQPESAILPLEIRFLIASYLV